MKYINNICSGENFECERTTIWRFKERGRWSVHSGAYRGNWSPYVPRNLILKYSDAHDWVLDQFVGSGTTAIEAALLKRNFIGIDINEDAIKLSQSNISKINSETRIFLQKGDATNLSCIKSNSIDLICSHPPYSDIIKYSNNIKNDLSCLCLKDFLEAMSMVAAESFRIIKKGKYVTVLIADVRKRGQLITLGMYILNIYLKIGFTVKEIIIKEQHNCSSTKKWEKRNNNFLLISHEYLFVFQK